MILTMSPPAGLTSSFVPRKHESLGIDSYVQVFPFLCLLLQVTSPLRRYNDLLCHRQIKAFLESVFPSYSVYCVEEPLPYTNEDIEYMCKQAFEKERSAKRLQKHVCHEIISK